SGDARGQTGWLCQFDPGIHRPARGYQRLLKPDGRGVRRSGPPCPRRRLGPGPAARGRRRDRGRVRVRMMSLHPDFLNMPIAHRGLHGPGMPENSMAAFRAAIAAGYGIECDIQRTADGTALVFHDDDLPRLTGAEGPVGAKGMDDLSQLRLLGTSEPIPTLADLLAEVAGRVPLLIEIK